jgi:hypothetical protein
MRSDFALVRIGRIFHATDGVCFKRLAFFDQFLNAFAIRIFQVRQALEIAGLTGGFRSYAFTLGSRRNFQD